MPGPGPPAPARVPRYQETSARHKKSTTSCRYRTALLNRVVLQNKECKRAAIVCASKMKTDRIPGNVKIDWSTATEQLEARYFSITQVEQLPGRNLTLQWWCGCSGFGGCGVVCGCAGWLRSVQMVPSAIITSPISAHHPDYPSSHREIIIVIMIIAMIILLIQIVIVTIMPMIIERSIILASVEIMRGRWAEGASQVGSLAWPPPSSLQVLFWFYQTLPKEFLLTLKHTLCKNSSWMIGVLSTSTLRLYQIRSPWRWNRPKYHFCAHNPTICKTLEYAFNNSRLKRAIKLSVQLLNQVGIR